MTLPTTDEFFAIPGSVKWLNRSLPRAAPGDDPRRQLVGMVQRRLWVDGGLPAIGSERQQWVEVRPWLRFHIPLIEPDRRVYRIRLSDKTSRLHPRRAATKLCQPYEPEMPVKVREWISSALASPDLVLEAQPPAQPHSRVVVEHPIRFAG